MSSWYKIPLQQHLGTFPSRSMVRMTVAVLVVCVLAALAALEPVSSVPLTLYKHPEASAPQKVCPGGDISCDSGGTCCKTGKTTYGCCEHEKAECCSDMKHCCPSGYYCGDSACHPTSEHPLLDMASLQPHASEEGVSDIVCPDYSTCPTGQTCCAFGDSKYHYGCCVHPNADCCPDLKHCCASGFQCDYDKCIPGSHPLVELVTLPVEVEGEVPAEGVVCQDGGMCATGDTCCSIGGSRFGCCKKPNAVCCADLKHCCSTGSVCDKGKCIRFGESHPLLQLVVRPMVASLDILCPDSGSCPSGDTCCKNGATSYGCCPQLNAVCCSDMKHCCPSGTACSGGKCLGSTSHPLLQLTVRPLVASLDIYCPGGSCPSGNTCCRKGTTTYGCCPFESATCCSDWKHCCPYGFLCSGGKCLGSTSHPLLQLTVRPVEEKVLVQNIICPDKTSECPSGDTCCKNGATSYGCCPQLNAVCCSDMKHCCPSGTACSGGKCLGSTSHPLLQLTVRPVEEKVLVQNIICPDKTSECPSGDTCCKNGATSYGCCPQSNAVCCSDMKHCCPSGTACSGGKCIKVSSHPLLDLAGGATDSDVGNVVCPNGINECSDGATCCKVSDTLYGCCPKGDAVCCADGKHCCPDGYTCEKKPDVCKEKKGGESYLKLIPFL